MNNPLPPSPEVDGQTTSTRFKWSLIVVISVLFSCLFIYLGGHMSGPHQQDETIIIPAGSGLRGSMAALEEAQALRSTSGFAMLAVASGRARKFKAGEYRIPAHASTWDIIDLLSEGRTIIHRITIPEGWTVEEITTVLEKIPQLKGALPADITEGSLLPETYHYTLGDTRAELVTRMQQAMQKTLDTAWQTRDPLVTLKTPAEALTLASLVEEETGRADERPRIAAVFYNRLRIGMRLQTDPSVLYGLGRGGAEDRRGLSLRDLQSDTPYNTYVIPALPPGPIACPGKAAIEAVLHPPATEELFFVADGQGGHRFAATLAGHNDNVQLYRQQRRP